MAPDSSAQQPTPKPRRRVILPRRREEMPKPPPLETPPVWRRAWFWMFAASALLILAPFVRMAWNILRPDDAPPAPVTAPVAPPATDALSDEPAPCLAELTRARLVGGIVAALPAEDIGSADIAAGRAFDPVRTPRFLSALREATVRADALPADASLAKTPFRLDDIAARDGALRARCAAARDARDAGELNRAGVLRMRLAAALRVCAMTPEALMEALDHERSVYEEVRSDAPLLVTDREALKVTLATLARQSLPPSREAAAWTARAFDFSLGRDPDAGLRAMRAAAPARGESLFMRLALASRRPNAHRAKVSALLADFAAAAAKPVFPLAYQTFSEPGRPKDIRLAARLLRDEALNLAPTDPAVPFFFRDPGKPGSAFESAVLKFNALTTSDDIYGEALLLRRHARLSTLLARRDRTRFDAAGTAYALALESRRDPVTGKPPRDLENLFDGLLDTVPNDPFSDDALLYSRKKMTLHSPGADDTDLGGLDEAEFATENAQLWEPTIPLEPERPTNPAAFGVRPSDLDRPVRKPWELPQS